MSSHIIPVHIVWVRVITQQLVITLRLDTPESLPLAPLCTKTIFHANNRQDKRCVGAWQPHNGRPTSRMTEQLFTATVTAGRREASRVVGVARRRRVGPVIEGAGRRGASPGCGFTCGSCHNSISIVTRRQLLLFVKCRRLQSVSSYVLNIIIL